MEDTNCLLTDRYVDFAQRVIDLHKSNKNIEIELQKNRNEYDSLLTAQYLIKVRVSEAQTEYEAWKKEYLNVTDS